MRIKHPQVFYYFVLTLGYVWAIGVMAGRRSVANVGSRHTHHIGNCCCGYCDGFDVLGGGIGLQLKQTFAIMKVSTTPFSVKT